MQKREEDACEISIMEGKLVVEGREIPTEYPVREAFQEGAQIIILLDPDSYTESFGQFRNLVSINYKGESIWEAPLPTTQSGDRYYKISSKSPLIAYSVWSYRCEIDPQTGQILRREFYK